MKLQRTTLILILLALGLGSFVYFYEIQWKTNQQQIQQKAQRIFSFNPADVESLTIKTTKLILNLERNHNSEHPQWLIKSPVQAPAQDAYVSYLMDLLVGKSKRSLSIPASQLGEFGLDHPQASIDIKLKNQTTHKLILGGPDFNRNFLYAQIDPSDSKQYNTNVLLVSADFHNAVDRDLLEWKQSTDKNEATPLPSITLPSPSPTGKK